MSSTGSKRENGETNQIVNMDILAPEDYHKVVATPDSNFSPARNKAIVNETIASTVKYFNNIGKAIDDNLANRMDIFASYGNHRLHGGGTKKFQDYVGKKLVSELIGEKILSKIRTAQAANKLGGNTKFITL